MDIIGAGRSLYLVKNCNAHLWFVLTDPKNSNDEVVVVMVCSVQSYSDRTVILKKGDHPFIQHDSSIHYSTADYWKVSRIKSQINGGRCHLKEDMSKELLARVRQGLFDSWRTPLTIQEYCKECF